MTHAQPRIALVGFGTNAGGIGKVMLNLINAMAARGVPVDVLMPRVEGPDLERLDTRVRRLAIGKGVGAVLALARYFRESAPEAVICNKERANRDVVLARMIARRRVRVVFRVGTNLSVHLARRHIWQRGIKRLQIRLVYPRADLIAANSHGVADDVIRVTGVPTERVTLLPNATVPGDLAARAGEPVEHPWLSTGEIPVILAVGRLTRAKDFPTLIRAFARVAADRPCRLIILGEGKERAALRQLAVDCGVDSLVELPGYRVNPYAWMSRASVFVLSSAWEGMPNVLIEALACGTPVVATDCPYGPREILEQGRYGPLVPVGDEAAMADAIRWTLDDPLEARQLRVAAHPYSAAGAAEAYLHALLPEAVAEDVGEVAARRQ
ncbi:MAG: glycosyltransferase [Ectothiorhodospiraceae bacterium]|jgi:glycosyltransferase involved in cell wall biosynthesis